MVPINLVLFYASVCALLALCSGLLWRRRLAQSLCFSLYIASATGFSILYILSPASNTPQTFIVKQGLYDSLMFGMAMEISYKVFGAFRGIASRARALLASLVAGSSLLILFLTPGNEQYVNIGRYQPGITTAGIWCLTFVALLIVWYQIPVPNFTRAILLGYIPYLVVFVIVMDLLSRLGWGFVENLNAVKGAAYDAAVGYLAYAAWRKD